MSLNLFMGFVNNRPARAFKLRQPLCVYHYNVTFDINTLLLRTCDGTVKFGRDEFLLCILALRLT